MGSDSEASKKGNESEEEEEAYEVEEIIDYKVAKGKKSKNPKYEFEVKWKGYGWDETTWEPEDNLVGCDEILKTFKEKRKIGGGSKKKEEKKESQETKKAESSDDDEPISKKVEKKPEPSKRERSSRAESKSVEKLSDTSDDEVIKAPKKRRGEEKAAKKEKAKPKEPSVAPDSDAEIEATEANVKEVSGCKMDGGKCLFLIRFKSGKDRLVPKEDARELCPGKLCDFLLKRINFTTENSTTQANGNNSD